MGVWTTQVVPRVADKALGVPAVRAVRERVCAGLHGDVLEIGFGSGHNVPFYPPAVTGVWAVDPSAVARRLGAERIAASRVPVQPAGLDGQRIAVPDARFDSALSTFTLCTIPDAAAALREVLRALKPGAAFHFVEHGRSPDPKVATWQRRLEPVNRRIAGGCMLTRAIAELIAGAGFETDSIETYYLPGDPKPFGYLYEGRARRPGVA
jgi:SAM-dependent methyltransferase